MTTIEISLKTCGNPSKKGPKKDMDNFPINPWYNNLRKAATRRYEKETTDENLKKHKQTVKAQKDKFVKETMLSDHVSKI